MPKIIVGVKEKIIETTKQQLFEQGYANISLRKIASNCHIAVGTIYNYFPDKETIIANILLEDWKLLLLDIEQNCQTSTSIIDGMFYMYKSIENYGFKYQKLFEQASSHMQMIQTRHQLLIQQLSQKLELLFSNVNIDSNGLINILTECILTCALQESITDDEFKALLYQLFRKEG